MKKNEWLAYPENKPTISSIFAVLSFKQEGKIELDDFSHGYGGRSSKRVLRTNDEKKILFGIWKYIEICEEVNDEFVIYKKEWGWFDHKNEYLFDVTHFLYLPDFPKGIYQMRRTE
jgi:hypothetical protein